jgi:RND family efflux transporter MFP subunit
MLPKIVFAHTLALALASSASATPPPAAPAKSVLTVTAAAPELLDWPVTIPAGGWCAPWQEAVVASEIEGLRITQILADTGDIVKQGQPLATLARETVLAGLRKQEASLASAEALHAVAQATADRARGLRPTGAQTAQQYDEAIQAEKTAAAALDMARAELETQRIRLAQTTITAPDDGVITARAATLGSVVAAGTELFRLIRQQRIEWQAEVGAQHAGDIRPGQSADIALPGGAMLTGSVRAIAPAAARDTARSLVYVALPQTVAAKPGVYATGGITLKNAPALTVPETALVLRDGFHYLYTLPTDATASAAFANATTIGADGNNSDNNARVTRIRVETGRRRDGRVEITTGLAPGARVVQSGGAFLSDGALVAITAAQ